MSQSKEGKGPSIDQRLEEARAVADQFGCPVVINTLEGNGTASIIIGRTPELTALVPDQQHVIYPPEGGPQVFPTKLPEAPANNGKPAEPERGKDNKVVKPRKRGKVHDLTGFTGFWRGTYYENGVSRPRNGNNGQGNHKKR